MIIYLIFGALAVFGASTMAIGKSDSGTGPMNNWTTWDHLFKKYGSMYGVPWQWGKAVAMNESSLGNAKSVALGLREPWNEEESKSYDGKSWGLMQVTLSTGKWLDPETTTRKLNDPEFSINLGMKYLGKMKSRFPASDWRSLEWTIKSYNQGPGNTDKERAGKISGYTGDYWPRFQRNLKKVEENS